MRIKGGGRVNEFVCRLIAYTSRSGSSELEATTVEAGEKRSQCGNKEKRPRGEGQSRSRAALRPCREASNARRASAERQARAVSDSSESIPASIRCEASGTSAVSSPARKAVMAPTSVPPGEASGGSAILLPGAGFGVGFKIEGLRRLEGVDAVMAECVGREKHSAFRTSVGVEVLISPGSERRARVGTGGGGGNMRDRGVSSEALRILCISHVTSQHAQAGRLGKIKIPADLLPRGVQLGQRSEDKLAAKRRPPRRVGE